MATPKLNPSRSIAVIPSDYCNIPNPALLIGEPSASDVMAGSFKVLNKNLIAFGVKAGDIVYDYGNGVAATINNIEFINDPLGPLGSYTFVGLNASVTVAEGTIQIYNGEDDSTGCVLYVGTGGVLKVMTEGGDEVLFQNVPTGSFLPVQVLKIGIEPEAENASNILALR